MPILSFHSAVILRCRFASHTGARGAETNRRLKLSQALKRVVAANPRLAVAERELGVAVGRRIQAAAIPNPEFAPLVENVLGSGQYKGSQSAQTTLTLSQLIEFPGKRDARIAATSAEFDSSQWQLQAERLDVLSELLLPSSISSVRSGVYRSSMELSPPSMD